MKVPVKGDNRSRPNAATVGKALKNIEHLSELQTAKRKAKQFRRDFDQAYKDVEQSIEKKDAAITKTCLGVLFDTAGELFRAEAEVRDAWCSLDKFNQKEFMKYQDQVYEYRKKWIAMWAYVTADIYLDPDEAERKDYMEQYSGASEPINVLQTNKSFQRFKFVNDSARVLTYPRNIDNDEFTEQAIAALLAAQEKYLTETLKKRQELRAKKLQKKKEKLDQQNDTEEEKETKEKSESKEENKMEEMKEKVVEEKPNGVKAEIVAEDTGDCSKSEEEDDEPISDSEEYEEATDDEDTQTTTRKTKKVLEPIVLYPELEHWDLGEGLKKLEINITDTTSLAYGILSGYIEGTEHSEYVYTTLTQKMTEYCNSEVGQRPYLPESCELCIVKPPHTQAMRAFRTCKPAASSTLKVKVCFVDYGHYEDVPLSHIRKIQPEFVKGVPCAVFTFEIADFPKEELNEDMVMKATEFLRTPEGKLRLTVNEYKKDEPGYYTIEVPEMLKLLSTTQ